MIRHLTVRAFVPTIAAAALAASTASADAIAHAATIRGIGARLLAQ
jgi:hypothetical protein